jgi:uncharacterized protein YecA (UPF0149 family)
MHTLAFEVFPMPRFSLFELTSGNDRQIMRQWPEMSPMIQILSARIHWAEGTDEQINNVEATVLPSHNRRDKDSRTE